MGRTRYPSRGKGMAVAFLREHATYIGAACLWWPFSRDTKGYGNFGYHGKPRSAHRFMCELVHGAPPTPEHHAAHSCDNGHLGCVNPRHLSWQTPSANAIDKRRTGRYATQGSRFKLTPLAVAEIRAMRGIKTQERLAAQFGVSRRNIGMIQTGKSWLTGDYAKRGFLPGDPRNPSIKKRLAREAGSV